MDGNEMTTILSEHKLQFHMQRKYVGTLVVVILPDVTLTVLRYDLNITPKTFRETNTVIMIITTRLLSEPSFCERKSNSLLFFFHTKESVIVVY